MRKKLFDLALHGIAIWTVAGLFVVLAVLVAGWSTALVLHAFALPVIAALIAGGYFNSNEDAPPLPTAAALTALVLFLDVAVSAMMSRSFQMFGSIRLFWAPLVLVLASTWVTGVVVTRTARMDRRGTSKPLR